MNNMKSVLVLGILLAFGLIGAGYQVSTTIYKAKLMSNTVTVKGFAEKDVKADSVIWKIVFSTTGDNLDLLYNKLNFDSKRISDYLIKNGIKYEDIKIENVNVTDALANQYREKEVQKGSRYVLTGTVSINSNDVDIVEKSLQSIGMLVKDGLVLGGTNVKYNFTKLSEIKPEMLREATKNARNAAEQFAADAGSKVGSIQSATQGFFSILEKDTAGNGDNNTNDYSANNGIDKRVRVVTTITYYLEK
jgi:hypothetical protein